jgi:hypothetical protein
MLPDVSSSGPPLFPGCTGAEVCSILAWSRIPSCSGGDVRHVFERRRPGSLGSSSTVISGLFFGHDGRPLSIASASSLCQLGVMYFVAALCGHKKSTAATVCDGAAQLSDLAE